MPSYARQGIRAFQHKDNKKRKNIYVIKHTGYIDVWINGQHFYYNYSKYGVDPTKIDWEELVRKSSDSGKKGIVVIRRK